MDNLYTQEGQRDELAVIEVVKPEGYIADQIFPIVNVSDKSGTVYYATVNADSAAQTGRAAGGEVTGTQISDSSTTFTCAERIKRYSITPDEVKTMGGIQNADQVGAKASKRSVHRAIETLACASVLNTSGSADAAFDAAKVLTDVQAAVDSMELYEGNLSLITSTRTLKAIVQKLIADSTAGKVFSRIISGSSPSVAVQGMNFAAWREAVAMYFGVDQVLVGHSSVWNAGSAQGRFAIAKLDDGVDPLAHKYRPILGKRFQFLRDGENAFYIETIPDRKYKNNHYDASVWDNVVTFNSGAKYVFGGVLDA